MNEQDFIEYIQSVIENEQDFLEEEFDKTDAVLIAQHNIEKKLNNEKTTALIDELKSKVEPEQQEAILGQFSKEEVEGFEKNVFGTAVSYFSHTKVDWAKVNSLSDLKEAVREKMDPNDFDKKFSIVSGIPASKIVEKADTLIPMMTSGLSELQMEEIADNSRNFTLYTEREVEDVSTQRFEGEINAIEEDRKYKRIIGEKNKKSDELKHAIEYAGSLRKADEKFNEEIDYIKTNVATEFTKRNQDIVKEKRQDIYNLNLDENAINDEEVEFDGEVLETKEIPGIEGKTIDVLKSDNMLESMENSKVIYSDETKQSLSEIFKKMDEYGYYNDGTTKENETLLGLSKLDDARVNLDKALKEKNYTNIVKYANEHEKETKQINEIFGMMDKKLPIYNDVDYPLNSDVANNDNFEVNMRNNIPKTSQFNGLYSVLSFLKKNDISVDDYLENPRKALEVETNKTLNDLDIDASTKDKSLGQAIFKLSTTSVGNKTEEKLKSYSYLMESAVRFEKDRTKREENYIAEKDYLDTTLKRIEGQSKIHDNLISQDTELFKNMLITGGKMEPSQLTTTATYDPKTMKFKEPAKFDRAEYISKSNIDFKELRNNLNKSMIDFMKEYQNQKANGKTNNMDPDKFVKMSQQLAYEACMLKKGQKDDPEYQKLLKFVNEPIEYMNNLIATQKGAIKFQAKPDKVEDLDKDDKNYDKFKDKNKNFGKEIIDKDKKLNKNLYKDLKTIEKAQKQNNAELELSTREKIENNLKARKEELEKEFKEGKITEKYYNERKEQLDSDNVVNTFEKDKKLPDVPKMFRADKFPSKKEYLASTGLEDLSKEEADTLYESEKNKAEMEKDDFLTRKFLEDKKFIDPKRPRCTKEEMDEAFAEHDEAKNENELDDYEKEDVKKDDLEKENLVEKIHVDLDEPEMEVTDMIPKQGLEVKKEKNMGMGIG